MRADFKGSIPSMVTRQVAAQQGGIVGKLRVALDKRYKNAAAALAADKAKPLINLDQEVAEEADAKAASAGEKAE